MRVVGKGRLLTMAQFQRGQRDSLDRSDFVAEQSAVRGRFRTPLPCPPPKILPSCGHFAEPVVLESRRPPGDRFECRVRLFDGTPDEAIRSRDEGGIAFGQQDELLRWCGESFDIIFSAVDHQQLVNPWHRATNVIASPHHGDDDRVAYSVRLIDSDLFPFLRGLYSERPERLVGPENHPGNLDHLLILVAR